MVIVFRINIQTVNVGVEMKIKVKYEPHTQQIKVKDIYFWIDQLNERIKASV
jgi:hypothetical protein